MDAGELAGYVTQNPGEAQRVFELETARASAVLARRCSAPPATTRTPSSR
jgi:hypothetical protein